MAVIASFLVGSNFASTLGGLSSPLSTPVDRERFLARHRAAAGFIIGKQSAEIENYSESSRPIYVLSRSTEVLSLKNSAMEQIKVDDNLIEVIHELSMRVSGDIVIEAGATLLTALIEAGVIDLLELTISPVNGDGDFLDVEALLPHFETINEVVIDGTRLLQCRDESDSADS